jgi:hypothetical protein
MHVKRPAGRAKISARPRCSFDSRYSAPDLSRPSGAIFLADVWRPHVSIQGLGGVADCPNGSNPARFCRWELAAPWARRDFRPTGPLAYFLTARIKDELCRFH